MTSLMDQYENEKLKVGEQERPIFSREDSFLPLTEEVTLATIANDQIVVSLKNLVILWFCRADSLNWSKVKEIDISRLSGGRAPSGIFLDPSAFHLLIAFQNELFYLYKKSNKPKIVGKLKGVEVTAVGWEEGGWGPGTTGPILLGTSKGVIYETEISQEDNIFSGSNELYAKQVFDLGRGQGDLGIWGLHWRKGSELEKCFVVATTTERLYQFTGTLQITKEPKRPLLQQLFNKYLTVNEGFQQLPSNLKYSRLELRGKILAWLTQTGVFMAQVDARKDEEGLLVGTQMHPLEPPSPLDILVTDYHLVLLYKYHVDAINILSQETVYHEKFNQRLKRITKDPVKNTIWVIGETEIFGYKINKEDRNVWKIYAERGDWESAKNYCKNDPESLDEVKGREADFLFELRRYEESAVCYANTNLSFEKVALQFLRANQHQALKAFLKLKLNKIINEGGGEKAQITMLIMWILELLVKKLAEEEGDRKASIQEELDEFISRKRVKKCIEQNRAVVYNLFSSHGDEENLIALAKRTRDTSRVITHYINKGQSIKALDELCKERDNEIWYKFASPLIESVPKQFFSAVIEKRPALDPARLYPALVSAADTQHEELMKYLNVCVMECGEKAVHNLILSLYARRNEQKLMSYLEMQGREASLVQYDILYGARICRELGRSEACVELLALLGLWESAVKLALTIDVTLAKKTASLSSCPQHLQRKLWLQIAEHVVKEKNDIAQAMEFLKECEQIKIEDILPFFPDFSSIDHFKDAICSSLQEYNQHIQEVKEEMEDATKSAESIRTEILSFRKKYMEIREGDRCECCKLGLLLRPFYAFPCGHRFHSDCLASSLPPNSKEDITESIKKEGPNSYLASQCLYCGDLAIQLIDKGFVEENDFDRIQKEWE